MTYSELKDLADSKKIEIQELASALDMTTNGLRASIRNETIPIKKLKILCETLRINPMMFFDHIPATYINAGGHVQSGNGNQITIESKDREIELLKEQLTDKNEIIRLLKEAKANDYGYGIVASPQEEYGKIK